MPPSHLLAVLLTAVTWLVFTCLYLVGWRDLTGGALVTLDQIVGSSTVAVALVVAVLLVVRWRVTADPRYGRVAFAIFALGAFRVGLGLIVLPMLPNGGPAVLRAIPAVGFLVALGFLIVPSVREFPRPRRRAAQALIAAVSVIIGAAVVASPAASAALTGQPQRGGEPGEVVAQVLVSAVWFVGLLSYWRETRRTGSYFDVGVAGMLGALAQSRLAITLAVGTGTAWMAASQLFRLEAMLIIAIALNREVHDELLHSQVQLDRLLSERRDRDHADAERRHDVKSAVFSVVAAAQMLERHHGRLDAKATEVLARALAAETTHLQQLVLHEKREEVEAFLLGDVVRPLVVLEDARGQNMRFWVEDDIIVMGRPSEAAEAIRNVLDNARTHGGKLVSVRVARRGETGVVIVEDSGPGIPAEEQRAVFERGARGNGATADGSGLGLYVAARLLRDMGGDVWLDPKRSRGAAFTCCLPAMPANIRVIKRDVIDLDAPAQEELAR